MPKKTSKSKSKKTVSLKGKLSKALSGAEDKNAVLDLLQGILERYEADIPQDALMKQKWKKLSVEDKRLAINTALENAPKRAKPIKKQGLSGSKAKRWQEDTDGNKALRKKSVKNESKP